MNVVTAENPLKEISAIETATKPIKMIRQVLTNKIQTPDGTILESHHRHDYNSYKDANGQMYSIDGGVDYLKRSCTVNDYLELSLYTDSPFEYLRQHIVRGGRGELGNEELKYEKLSQISDDWLENLIIFEEEHRPNNKYLPFYKMEVQFRFKHRLTVK
jgi:translation initiation factor 2B subunit (eIF-2B alpha/beta/delta family)